MDIMFVSGICASGSKLAGVPSRITVVEEKWNGHSAIFIFIWNAMYYLD